MGSERRKTIRLDSRLFAELGEFGRGVVIDVSLSGFGVDTEADIPLDAVISCDLEIPVRLKAQVIRRVRDGQMKRYGLKFIDQGFFDKWLLKKMLKGPRQTKKI